MAVKLQLENMVFAGLEVPAKINRGGSQVLAVQRLVGGHKVIDSMGRDDAAITWTGTFLGGSAQARSTYLDSLRIAGKAVPLTWGPNSYTVVLKSVALSDSDPFVIDYTVECEVQSDNVTPVTPGNLVSADDQIANDMNACGQMVDQAGDSTLSGLFATMKSAIAGVSTFANAAQSTIAGVLGPIAAVQGQVQMLLSSAANTVQSIATVGGVLPNNPIAQNVNRLAQMATSYQRQPLLVSLQSTLGRVQQNVQSIGTNVRSQTFGGGNLMTIAANQFGDASRWTAIATANGLSDPQLSGINTLHIPSTPGVSGGLLV